MKKIKKHLEEHGYKIEFIGCYSRKQYRCRYTCLEEAYKITKDNKIFDLTNKITGKKLYMMDEKIEGRSKLIAGGESEKSFIEYFESYLKQIKA